MAKTKSTWNAYSGILSTPIRIGKWQPTLRNPWFKETPEYRVQFDERIDALFHFYGIDKSHDGYWQKLALSLADHHVPAFKIQPPPRKASAWDAQKYRKLRLDVDRLRVYDKKGRKRPRRIPATRAISFLMETKPNYLKGIEEATVRRRYVEAKVRRKADLRVLLSPYTVVKGGGDEFVRIPDLNHSYWKKLLEKGDPRALEWRDRLTSLLSGADSNNRTRHEKEL